MYANYLQMSAGVHVTADSAAMEILVGEGLCPFALLTPVSTPWRHGIHHVRMGPKPLRAKVSLQGQEGGA